MDPTPGLHTPRALASAIAASTGEAFSAPNPEAARWAPLVNAVVAVEGIICAGKSTLLGAVDARLREAGLGCRVLHETPDPGLLGLFYSDMARYGFALQLDMLRQRQAINRLAHSLSGRSPGGPPLGGIVWTDRSLWGDAVFACVNYVRGNISPAEFEVYRSVLDRGGPYQYDFVVFLDVEVPRALDLCRGRDRGESGELRGYFETLRLTYYLQLREQGRRGLARVVYVRNDPFVSAEDVLVRLLRAPSVDLVRAMFESAPDLEGDASPEQVAQAFASVRGMYDEYYARALGLGDR